MKKSVKELLKNDAYFEIEGVIHPTVFWRLIRRACNEAYCVGRSHGIVCGGFNIARDRRYAVSQIIDGPKKGKRK